MTQSIAKASTAAAFSGLNPMHSPFDDVQCINVALKLVHDKPDTARNRHNCKQAACIASLGKCLSSAAASQDKQAAHMPPGMRYDRASPCKCWIGAKPSLHDSPTLLHSEQGTTVPHMA